MPQRFLRPGITTSERFNSVPHDSGNLFVRLLTMVDDYGRCDGRPSVIWGNCFAVWNDLNPEDCINLQQVARMLQQLAATCLIELYEVNGKKVLQILQWQERIREGTKSRWPAKQNLQQVAASCSKLLPSSPPPSPPPSPSLSFKRNENGADNIVQHTEAKIIFGKLSEDVFGKSLPVTQWPADMEHWLDAALPMNADDVLLLDWFYRLPPAHPIFTVTLRRQSMRALIENVESEVQKVKSALRLLEIKKDPAELELERDEMPEEWTRERVAAMRELFPGVSEDLFRKSYTLVAGDVRTQIESRVKLGGQNGS